MLGVLPQNIARLETINWVEVEDSTIKDFLKSQ